MTDREDPPESPKAPTWLIVTLGIVALVTGALFVGSVLSGGLDSKFYYCKNAVPCPTSLYKTVKAGLVSAVATLLFVASIVSRK